MLPVVRTIPCPNPILEVVLTKVPLAFAGQAIFEFVTVYPLPIILSTSCWALPFDVVVIWDKAGSASNRIHMQISLPPKEGMNKRK
jgi:hypothetical protein